MTETSSLEEDHVHIPSRDNKCTRCYQLWERLHVGSHSNEYYVAQDIEYALEQIKEHLNKRFDRLEQLLNELKTNLVRQ